MLYVFDFAGLLESQHDIGATVCKTSFIFWRVLNNTLFLRNKAMENRWFRYSAAALLSTWILFASVTGSQATTEENSTNEVDPSFVSKRQRFRVVIGETVRLPCQVDNLGMNVDNYRNLKNPGISKNIVSA